jgi:hypothetical protein
LAAAASTARSKDRRQALRIIGLERKRAWSSASDSPASAAISVRVVRRQPWRAASASAAATTASPSLLVALRDAERRFGLVAMDGV